MKMLDFSNCLFVHDTCLCSVEQIFLQFSLDNSKGKSLFTSFMVHSVVKQKRKKRILWTYEDKWATVHVWEDNTQVGRTKTNNEKKKKSFFVSKYLKSLRRSKSTRRILSMMMTRAVVYRTQMNQIESTHDWSSNVDEKKKIIAIYRLFFSRMIEHGWSISKWSVWLIAN